MRALSALPPAGAEGGDGGDHGDADGDGVDDDDAAVSEAPCRRLSIACGRS